MFKKKRSLIKSVIASSIIAGSAGFAVPAHAVGYYMILTAGGPPIYTTFKWVCYDGLHGPYNDTVSSTVFINSSPANGVTGSVSPNPGTANVDVETVTYQAAANAVPGQYGTVVNGTGTGQAQQCNSYTWPQYPDSMTLIVQAAPPPRFTQAQKDAMKKAAAKLTLLGASEYAIANYCASIPYCKPVLIGLAGINAVAVAKLGLMIIDPYDPNYTAIALPVTPSYTAATATSPFDQPSADAINAVLQNQAQAAGVMQAITTAINRSSGAYAMGDNDSLNMQLMVASHYALTLSSLFNGEAPLLANVGTTLTAANFPITQITATDVKNVQADISANGLSSDMVQDLQQAGLDQSDIDTTKQSLLSVDPTAASGTLAAIFSPSDESSTLQAVGSSLVNMAASNNVIALAPGQSFKGSGSFTASNGETVTVNLKASVSSFSKKLSGSFSMHNGAGSDHFRFSFGKVLHASVQGTNVIMDGTYTMNSVTGTYTIVATAPSGSSVVNHITVSLSSGYSASGTLSSGSVVLQ
jgi:hypothetical protein